MGKVQLSEFEWKLCALALEHEKIPGFPELDLNLEEGNQEEARKNLLQENMLEETENGYQFTPLCQYFFTLMSEADAWFMLEKEGQSFIRRIYVKDADYLCVDEKEQGITLLLLPILPLAVGAVADAIGDEISDMKISGCSGTRVFDQESLRADMSVDECINFMTVWLLEGLREERMQDGR